jgi:polysaccharide pyruvyl transferase WcaK-like protein
MAMSETERDEESSEATGLARRGGDDHEVRPRQRRSGLFDGLARLAGKAAKSAFEAAGKELDPDRLLQRAMATTIEAAASRYAVDPGAQWRPGEPLRLLFAGYSGTRNTGADVRVEEMVRQVRHLFGDEHVALSLLTIDPALSRGYFRTVEQLHLPQFFPPFLYEKVHGVHGVIACEGSMFKSKFANALSTMMVGALGVAAAENKLAIGYGGEAGAMDPSLQDLVRTYCRDALIVVRNKESGEVLANLGVRSKPGTDTAWTFDPAGPEVGARVLRDAGWDGVTPVLVVCPINPFWWPVKPDVAKGVVQAFTGAHDESHYDSFYFHKDGDTVREKQRRYLGALAEGITSFLAEHDAFPVIVGMEQLDRRACEGLSKLLADRTGRAAPPVIVSDEHDMYEMVSVLRMGRALLSSRYHAIVTSMPGLVPSAGVTMDERIRNLMTDRGQPELCLGVEDADLGERVGVVLRRLWTDGDAVADGIGRTVVTNLERMGEMGVTLVDFVRARHPQMPVRAGLGSAAAGGLGEPWEHLPPLPPAVAALVAKYRETPANKGDARTATRALAEHAGSQP